MKTIFLYFFLLTTLVCASDSGGKLKYKLIYGKLMRDNIHQNNIRVKIFTAPNYGGSGPSRTPGHGFVPDNMFDGNIRFFILTENVGGVYIFKDSMIVSFEVGGKSKIIFKIDSNDGALKDILNKIYKDVNNEGYTLILSDTLHE